MSLWVSYSYKVKTEKPKLKNLEKHTINRYNIILGEMSMKKIVCSILLLIFFSSTATAQTLYEKKLEYRRKKIDIMVRTRYVGEVEREKFGDIYEYTYTSEAGYSYKTTTTAERMGLTTEFKRVSDWVIVKGGIRELDDVEFLYLTENHKLAREIEGKVEARSRWRTIGMLTGLVGIGVIISGSGAGDSGTITTGAVISLLGVVIGAFNYPVRHYIYPDFAQEQADKYNIRLKKDLELPIDFE